MTVLSLYNYGGEEEKILYALFNWSRGNLDLKFLSNRIEDKLQKIAHLMKNLNED